MSGRSSEVEGTSRVPLVDLRRQHAPILDDLLAAVRDVAEESAFVLGEPVRRFEEEVAAVLGARHAVGVGSGTDALYLALRTLDLTPEDEVITSPFTFFATAGAIQNAGGRPVFADIEPRTFNLDPGAVADVVTDRTRAILPVHLFGQMAEMDPLLALAREHDLAIIEDAAQAIGARAFIEGAWRGAGTIGEIGCFSFYPTKNLGAWGDAGLLMTEDDDLAERLRRLRVHGQDSGDPRYRHHEVGVNAHMDGLQAAVLRAKLPHLADWTEHRRANAAAYDRALAGLPGITTPVAEPDRLHVYHQYTIRAERRDELRAFLDERGIDTGIYYPIPLHLQSCFEGLGYGPGDFPEAERAAREALSLPVLPDLTADERRRVIDAVKAFNAV